MTLLRAVRGKGGIYGRIALPRLLRRISMIIWTDAMDTAQLTQTCIHNFVAVHHPQRRSSHIHAPWEVSRLRCICLARSSLFVLFNSGGAKVESLANMQKRNTTRVHLSACDGGIICSAPSFRPRRLLLVEHLTRKLCMCDSLFFSLQRTRTRNGKTLYGILIGWMGDSTNHL